MTTTITAKINGAEYTFGRDDMSDYDMPTTVFVYRDGKMVGGIDTQYGGIRIDGATLDASDPAHAEFLTAGRSYWTAKSANDKAAEAARKPVIDRINAKIDADRDAYEQWLRQNDEL